MAQNELPAEQKTLDYFAEHPDELPEDISVEALDALARGGTLPESDDKGEGGGDTDDGKSKGGDDAPSGGSAAKPSDQPSGSDGKPAVDLDKLDDTTAVILTKDGKHHLPFSVLKGTRDELARTREQLEQANSRLEQALKELEEAKKAAAQSTQPASHGGGGDAKPVQDEIQNLGLPTLPSGELDWKRIEEEYPSDIVAALKVSFQSALDARKEVQELRAKVDELAAGYRERVQDEEAQAREYVQSVIDSIPILAYWQANDPVMWKKATEVDHALRQTEAFADVSLEDRFKHVVRLLGHDPDKPLEPTKEDLQRQALERLRFAGGIRVPRSHTDLPGGKEPPQSERESFEAMDVTQVASAFERLSPEQQEELLARL